MITFAPATYDDCAVVARNLRALDREELRLTGAPNAEAAMRHAVALSEGMAVTARDGDEPAAILGLVPNYLLGEGVPWMLGTDKVALHGRTLLTYAQPLLDHWLGRFPIILNEVWVGNVPAVRFLRRLGFEFAEPRRNEYGADMALFYMRRS